MKTELTRELLNKEVKQKESVPKENMDLTKNKIIELQRQGLKFLSLYNSMPDLCRTINKDGIIIDCNQSYLEHLGYSREEAIGSSIFLHCDKSSENQLQDSFDAWKKTGTVSNRKVLMKKKDGKVFPALLSATNFYDVDGSILGSNTIIKDISEIQTLLDVDKAKTKFSSMITHDLKGPLSPILAYSELLLKEKTGKLNEIQKVSLQGIFDGATTLLHSVQNLYDIHRYESAELKLRTSDLFVKDLIEKSVENKNKLAKEKNVDIVINSEPSLKIECDENKVLEIIEKLVENSIKFVPETGGRIEVSAKKDNDSIVFMVKDNGVGISKDEQKNLFIKFYELDMSFNRKSGVPGLGLIICKSLIDAHHGKIWLESQEEKGTIFYFSIPIMIKK